MKKLPLSEIIVNVNGKLIFGTDNIVIDNLVTRISRAKENSLVLDLYQDRLTNKNPDLGKNTYAVITDKPENFKGLTGKYALIQVEDSETAYWDFITYYRGLFDIPVIGITGTCGKTTTKEMIKHILSGSCRVDATYKSLNALHHHLSYLLEMDDETQAGVFEMGVAAAGDLLFSCAHFKPCIGVITNIGVDHLQAFSGLEGYIKAKSEILEGLADGGTVIVNADDENIKKMDFGRYKGNIFYFGFSDKSHFRISNVKYVDNGLEFTLKYGVKRYNLFIPGYGDFNVYNAAAAIAAAHSVGFGIEEAVERLKTFKHVERHFEFRKGINGSTVIDDTWSTNPTSAEVALKLLKSLSNGKKTIAAMGKMSLLGSKTKEYHNKIGKKIADFGINQLVVIGDDAWDIGYGAMQAGMSQTDIFLCNNSADALLVLKKILDENSILLVKTTMKASYSDLMNELLTTK